MVCREIYGTVTSNVPGLKNTSEKYVMDSSGLYHVIPDDKTVLVITPEAQYRFFVNGQEYEEEQFSSEDEEDEVGRYKIPKEVIKDSSGKALWTFPGEECDYPSGYQNWSEKEQKQWKSATKHELIKTYGGRNNISPRMLSKNVVYA